MNIYVAATRQNDGKTVTALGLVRALQKRVGRVGYIKPVGQHYLEVDGARIDKDAVLMRDAAGLDFDLQDMSPVAVPRGFTESYLDHPNREELEKRILGCFARASKGADITVIEGTGHAGVGSVFDLSNASVARLLSAPVLMVSAGGIGRPIDELCLNKAVFDREGVPIAGVVVNKVEPAKYDKINKYVRKGLARHGMRVWGVLPYNDVLSSPSIEELVLDLNAVVLSGAAELKTSVQHFVIGAMPPHAALDYFHPGSLLITPGNREDLIMAALSQRAAGRDQSMAGIVLTCGERPHPSVMNLIVKSEIPVVMVEEDTFETASRMHSLIVKIRATDIVKIAELEQLTEEYLDIDGLLKWLEAN
jgi:BioD-like phosphotransacetylase family protein